MSYQFPRRVLRAQDVLDPIELTQDISPAAERLSGRLNAHNFDDAIASSVTLDDAAYSKAYFASVEADPKLGLLGVFLYPKFPGDAGADPNAYRVTNTFEWQTIEDSSGAALRLTVTTGGSVLWVNAFAQYFWAGFNDGSLDGGVSAGHYYVGLDRRSCNVQFALRVDGAIVPDTITGVDQVDFRSSIALKAVRQRGAASYLPGPQDIRGQAASSLGPACLPVRIGLCLPVQSGQHTIELVVRRVPEVRDEPVDLTYVEGDFVAVFNRQLLAIDLKSFPVDSVGGAEVSAPGWDEEDLIDNASIYTQRVQPVIAGYNAVKEGNLARGALTHYHLPSTLLAGATTEKNWAAPEEFNNFYPGFTSSTVTGVKDSGSPGGGWYLLSTGSALDQIKTNTTIDATKRSMIVVLANTQLINVSNQDMNNFRFGLQDQFAAFRIMYKLVGDPNWYSIKASTGYVNSFLAFTRSWDFPADDNKLFSSDQADERVEVALMAVLDLRTVQLPAQVEHFGLFGAVVTLPNTLLTIPPYTRYQVRRGNIIALQMRP